MNQEPGWAQGVAADIGRRVARYRGKMSAQQLADRCKSAGMPALSRIVITRLENGRREAVSTAELQVLAKALDVAPILLLFPLGHDLIEVLPGQEVGPYAAIEWFTGRSAPADARKPQEGPVALWDQHRTYDGVLARYARGNYQTRVPEPAIFAGEVDAMVTALRRNRQAFRDLGLTPPPLRPETARFIDEQDTDMPVVA